MNLFATHLTALAYWRSQRRLQSYVLSAARPSTDKAPSTAEAKELCGGALGAELPVHISVGSQAARVKSPFVACHVWPGPLSARSFVRLEPGVYVSSPEALFVQMAALVDVLDLLLLGFELCGGYAPSDLDARGFESRSPLTSVAALRRYVAKCRGLHGVKKAQMALRHIADGAASPMETAAVMLLTLPTRLGGYGLPLPELNSPVEVLRANAGPLQGAHGRQTLWCDAYWRNERVALEYDSDMFHAASEKIARDANRRALLTKTDIKVVTLTKGQIMNANMMDEAALALSRALGRRSRSRATGVLGKRHRLRERLLHGRRQALPGN